MQTFNFVGANGGVAMLLGPVDDCTPSFAIWPNLTQTCKLPACCSATAVETGIGVFDIHQMTVWDRIGMTKAWYKIDIMPYILSELRANTTTTVEKVIVMGRWGD